MDERRVEELLGRRARGLRDEQSMRAAFGAVLRERARLRWRRRGLGLALAAAALLAVVLLWRPAPESRPAPGIAVALLDDAGRDLSLAGVVRGGPERPPFPARVLIEVAAEADGFARVVLFDALGAPHVADTALAVGRAALVAIELGAGAPGDDGGELDWLVVAAGERAALDEVGAFEAAVPARGEERRVALEVLAARLSAIDGLGVEARHLDVGAAR